MIYDYDENIIYDTIRYTVRNTIDTICDQHNI